MLQLKNISKVYDTGDTPVHALNGADIEFRENEFVSVLGQSGCGKTTLLNIIGGLDRYTDGDLIINGKSTKNFEDSDWDTYRNHSVGFVFQSYNLIPHQTVLANVELALTLSGVSKAERRRRATEALERVGLGDQLKKKPNQMSGGQMQRVAIARAIVNDPDILLADEPTGALDTATSIQIMDILKDIAKNKLVIMVTHNPELAEKYSTRIVKLLDGRVIDDSDPYHYEGEPEGVVRKTEVKKSKKTSMSFGTALSLSLNNLMTKKGRTVLTSFAGSIGIIGIALILALSTGIQAYIDTVQEDTLSTYPLSITKETRDLEAMMSAMTQVDESEDHKDSDMIYVDDSLGTMMGAMSATVSNNLEAFKEYLDEHYDDIKEHVSDIQYTYDFDLQVFTSDGKTQVNPTTIFENMGEAFSGVSDMMNSSGMSSMGGMNVLSEMIDNDDLLDQQYEVIAGEWADEADEVVLVVSRNNQISKMTLYMLGVLDQGELEDIMNSLMQDGEYDTTPLDPYTYDDFLNMTFMLLNTSDFYTPYDYDVNDGYTVDGKQYPVWYDERNSIGYDQEKFVTENGIELKITGIIRPREGVSATSISGAIGYTKELTDLILEKNGESDIIAQQKATPDHNVLTGLKFERTVYTKDNIDKLIRTIDAATMDTLYAYMTEQVRAGYAETPPVNKDTFIGFASVMSNEERQALVAAMIEQVSPQMVEGLCLQLSSDVLTVTPQNLLLLLPIFDQEQVFTTIIGLQQMCGEEAMENIYDYMNEQIMQMSVTEDNFITLMQLMPDDQFNELQDVLYSMAPQTDATFNSNLKLMGDASAATPASINFYAKDFAAKDSIEQFITDYNESVEEIDKLQYTDMIGILMSSISTIIDVISYVLIAFVAVSLVVSSIMIGIITYISVLERTKEIGILRAMGASKSDISRVFNAETIIIGFAAGAIGILFTLLLTLPINGIIYLLSGIPTIKAILPAGAAAILVLISMVLTTVAGLIPSLAAAKKDPVVALRTE
ncbi:MAG: ABC transporter ATP-binding protein/permease [Clostridia bacterium]|nr:ABC transporter ATP-binding protein/permease [Clostridia bacterium]